MAVNDDFQRLSRRWHRTHIELRIVLFDRADAGKNRARPGAPAMTVGARLLTCDPLTDAIGKRGAAVEAGRDFHAHPWASRLNALYPANIEFARLAFERAEFNLYAGTAQTFRTAGGGLVRVAHGGDNARYARVDQCIGAGRSSPVMIAGFERYIDGGAPHVVSARHRVLKRAYFSVGFARAFVPALADNLSITRADDNAAHARIRCRRVKTAFGERKRCSHEFTIDRRIRGHRAAARVHRRLHTARVAMAASAWLAPDRRRFHFLQCVPEIGDVLE